MYKAKIPAIIISVSFLPELLISLIRGYVSLPGIQALVVCAFTGFLLYFFITWFFLKKYQSSLKSYQIIGLVLIGLLIFQGPIRLFYFTPMLFTFPEFTSRLLGVFAGYCFYNRKVLIHKINLSVSVLIILFTCFYGYDLWMFNLDYGTYTGNVHSKGPNLLSLTYKDNDTLKKGKVTVMDFWFIGCVGCMEEFPEFQKIYSTYKNNPNIQFLAVDIPTRRDGDDDAFKILSNEHYSFPMAKSTDMQFAKDLKIVVYPTIIILDKHGDVVYRGDAKGLPAKIKSLL
ncbi:MAG: TlpA disulfide reductase family protein [Bacteroidota bacterium]